MHCVSQASLKVARRGKRLQRDFTHKVPSNPSLKKTWREVKRPKGEQKIDTRWQITKREQEWQMDVVIFFFFLHLLPKLCAVPLALQKQQLVLLPFNCQLELHVPAKLLHLLPQVQCTLRFLLFQGSSQLRIQRQNQRMHVHNMRGLAHTHNNGNITAHVPAHCQSNKDFWQ